MFQWLVVRSEFYCRVCKINGNAPVIKDRPVPCRIMACVNSTCCGMVQMLGRAVKFSQALVQCQEAERDDFNPCLFPVELHLLIAPGLCFSSVKCQSHCRCGKGKGPNDVPEVHPSELLGTSWLEMGPARNPRSKYLQPLRLFRL